MLAEPKSRPSVDKDYLQEASTPKRSQPRMEIRRAEDMGPTPERSAKSDFRTRQGVTRVFTTVDALYAAEDIGDEEKSAAERWYRDYVFGDHGYADFLTQVREPDYIKGDVHTFAISRGHAKQRISLVRENLGMCAHVRLEMMLAREMSFTDMGRALFPSLSDARSRVKVSPQCALVLEQLVVFYRNYDKARKAARNTAEN